jgi:hypothetical protein
MDDKTMLNVRITEEEASLLNAYAEMTAQTQTNVIRAFIRSLEAKVRRTTPGSVNPFILPSVPLHKHHLAPVIPAIYFFLTMEGEVLYVGKAANLHKRLMMNHHKLAKALAIDANARVHWVERRYGQERFETVCRHRFQPRLNERNVS